MGSVSYRGNNKYELTVSMGFDINGNRRRAYKTVTAKSMEAAEAKLEMFEAECRKKDVSGNNVTFDEMIVAWKELHTDLKLKKSTMAVYERLLKRNFNQFYGKRLKDIKHRDVMRWVSTLDKNGLSPKSVKNNYSLLRSILRTAVECEYLEKNPADNVSLPSMKHKEATYYTKEDTLALLKALNTLTGHELTYKVGILLALFGGLRKGEILGLDYDNVDFENNKINITQTRMVEVKNGVYTDTPKSVKSVRTITLPKEVMNEIRKLQEQQEYEKEHMPSDVWQRSNAVLKNEVGLPLYPQVLYRWFKRFQKKHCLPDMGLHGLRHTHASMLIDDGRNVEEVSKRMGHADKSTTWNIYCHLFEDSDEDTAESLSNKYFH